jgi:branched-chain amino acid aminotransferase
MSAALPCFVNGRRVDPAEPALRVDDAGFLLGLVVFETLLCEDGLCYFAEEHLERLAHGARALDIGWPRGLDPAGALAQIEESLAGRTAAVRLSASRGSPEGPTLIAWARPYDPPPAGGVVVALTARVRAGGAQPWLKSNNRIELALAREEARARGAWEGLVLTAEGDVCEGSVSNVLAVLGPRLVTPATARGCLAGIMRGRVLASFRAAPLALGGGGHLEVVEDRLEPADLARADELFLSNTTGRVIPVVSVLGLSEPRTLPAGGGPVTRAAAARIAAAERDYRERAVAERAGRPR